MSRGLGAVQLWVLRHLASQHRWNDLCLLAELPHAFAQECHGKPEYTTANRAERETVYRAVRQLRARGLLVAGTRVTTMWSRGNGWGKDVDLDRLWVRLTVDGYVASKRSHNPAPAAGDALIAGSS